jgi:transcriptional regulator with XRE-family HTH domain
MNMKPVSYVGRNRYLPSYQGYSAELDMLIAYKEKKGWSNEQAARLIGVGHDTFGRYVSGMKRPSQKTLQNVCMACEYLDLFSDDFSRAEPEPYAGEGLSELRKARKEAGVTMKQAARGAGVHYITWLRIEHGNNHPKIETREKMLDYLAKRGVFRLDEDVFPNDEDGSFALGIADAAKEARESPVGDAGAAAEYNELRGKIRNALAYLTPAEENVIRMRFGLDDGFKSSYAEIASSMRIDRMAAKNIEKKALRKMGKYPIADVLRPFI